MHRFSNGCSDTLVCESWMIHQICLCYPVRFSYGTGFVFAFLTQSGTKYYPRCTMYDNHDVITYVVCQEGQQQKQAMTFLKLKCKDEINT